MKNRAKSKAAQIAKIKKSIAKFGDTDGKRKARLAELSK